MTQTLDANLIQRIASRRQLLTSEIDQRVAELHDIAALTLALAATGWFAGGDRSAPAFDSTAALRAQVLRENAAAPAAPSVVMDDTLHQHVMRENGAR